MFKICITVLIATRCATSRTTLSLYNNIIIGKALHGNVIFLAQFIIAQTVSLETLRILQSWSPCRGILGRSAQTIDSSINKVLHFMILWGHQCWQALLKKKVHALLQNLTTKCGLHVSFS